MYEKVCVSLFEEGCYGQKLSKIVIFYVLLSANHRDISGE